MNRPRTKAIALIAAVLALVGLTSACSTYAPADSLILYYQAGTGETREWKQCIEPGTSGDFPVDDEIFQIPTSMRTWNIRPQGGDSDTPIRSGTLPTVRPNEPTQPGAEVVVWATADFYINTDCRAGKASPVVKFWENTGRRDWGNKGGIAQDGEEGFNLEAFRSMLVNTLVPAEEKAIREETRKYDADTLDANLDGVWTTMERNLAPSFLAMLRDKLGGDYFCGVGYARGAEVEWTEYVADGVNDKGLTKYREEKRKGTCPPVRIIITEINFADQRIADARTNVYTKKQDAEARRIEAESEKTRADILNGIGQQPGYVRLQEIEAERECAKNPNCTLIVTHGGDTDVNVNAGRR